MDSRIHPTLLKYPKSNRSDAIYDRRCLRFGFVFFKYTDETYVIQKGYNVWLLHPHIILQVHDI